MRMLLFALAALVATPAQAERLLVDYRVYPPLLAALDDMDGNVYFEQSDNPRFTLDRIKVQGATLDTWQEAIELVIYPRNKSVTAPLDWFEAFRSSEDKTCPSTWEVLGSDEGSVLFSRTQAKCKELAGQSRIYRALLGSRSVFIVAGLYRGELGDEMRGQWLKLFETARLEP
ncbi:hypothetical protein [Novosphingobium sp.]|uniref:hypothetical protein n=1 Tax=Novosphingobium sp. TaxID=1874826 RepID=UPI0035AE9106